MRDLDNRRAMTVGTTGAVFRLADGRTTPIDALSVVETVERVRSDRAVRIDPGWRHVDTAGHEHTAETYQQGARGTLRRAAVHVPCDGSCGGVCAGEGYSRPEYRCAACGEVVEPRFVPDEWASEVGVAVGVTREWSMTLGPMSEPLPVLAGREVPGEVWVMASAERLGDRASDRPRPLEEVRLVTPTFRLTGEMRMESEGGIYVETSATQHEVPERQGPRW